ncbi:MAG: hypothetical protein HYX41_03865 [Bdellovibrio sp.]|nr:hypothetical protein [Bdellovibrio sp.]
MNLDYKLSPHLMRRLLLSSIALGVIVPFSASANYWAMTPNSTSIEDGIAAIDAQALNQKLSEFDANPKAFMKDHKNIAKFNPSTGNPISVSSVFSQESISSGDFIYQKDFFQKSARIFRNEGRAPIYNNDDPENLVDQLRLTSLQAIEQNGLMTSRLSESPWSDDYWPIYTGVIAKRYADPNFPFSKNWNQNRWYILNSACSIDNLSPAEKYDLLVGDPNWTLTVAMANDGAKYGGGNVETWMGICHGWAPAAFMLSRPQNAVTLTAASRLPFKQSRLLCRCFNATCVC